METVCQGSCRDTLVMVGGADARKYARTIRAGAYCRDAARPPVNYAEEVFAGDVSQGVTGVGFNLIFIEIRRLWTYTARLAYHEPPPV